MDRSELLTVPEAAERLRISKWMLYNLIRSRRLRTVKIGSRRLVRVSAITEYLAALEERGGVMGHVIALPLPEPPEEPRRGRRSGAPTVKARSINARTDGGPAPPTCSAPTARTSGCRSTASRGRGRCEVDRAEERVQPGPARRGVRLDGGQVRRLLAVPRRRSEAAADDSGAVPVAGRAVRRPGDRAEALASARRPPSSAAAGSCGGDPDAGRRARRRSGPPCRRGRFSRSMPCSGRCSIRPMREELVSPQRCAAGAATDAGP